MDKRLQTTLSALLCISLLLIFTISVFQTKEQSADSVFEPITEETKLLILDAGHGGEDGGAVSLQGTAESIINLEIATKLDDLMAFCGVPTLMLRTEDISLHDDDASTLHEKKASDLKNRVALINQYQNATLISIHQNIYTSSSSSGAQVFYANNEASELFAVQTQQVLVTYLDPFNHRVAAQIPDSIYLMSHIDCTAILVECGFISNPEESVILQDASYQKKIAVAIGSSYLLNLA